ncbi:MAG TPA: alpha/beta hydrolase [bacterium]|nr:alpha/beta hydrolase [bacterium]
MKPAPYLPEIKGSPLPYQELGEGPTLVFVPGLDGTALLFYRQAPLLAQRFHVLTFPLPNDPASTMDSLVEDLRAIIQKVTAHRNTERVILCGESFGGALSMSFALAHPQLLDGLVIVNSFPKIRDRWRLKAAPLLVKALPWGAMGLVRRFTEARLHSPHTLPEDIAEFHRRMRWVGKAGYVRRLEILQSYDIEDKLGEIEVPTLLLAGEFDRLVPSVREAEFMAARMPHATARTLKGYGHICLINHDFNLLEYLLPWIEKWKAVNLGSG